MSEVNIFSTNKKYDVIYADPPWAYRQSGGGKFARHGKTAL